MDARRRWSKSLAAALALTLLFGIVPAFGVESEPTVAAHVIVTGTQPPLDLFGMTGAEARAAVAAACSTPTLAPLSIDATGKPFTLDVSTVVALDVDAMVADALAAPADTEIAARWVVEPDAIASFMTSMTAAVKRKSVSAKRTIVKHRLKVIKDVPGLALETTAAAAAVTDAVVAELAADGSAQATVTVPVRLVEAKTTVKELGKTIIVVLHERRVFLYKNAKLQRKYRCAIGMRAHPTPKGKFKVIAKSKHPTWRNPGSAWAKGMPAIIRPGYYNPLGLRALYINAPGIRIHGTSKTWSMGQAASHGCIRLTNSNIVKLYPLVPVGTPVWILS